MFVWLPQPFEPHLAAKSGATHTAGIWVTLRVLPTKWGPAPSQQLGAVGLSDAHCSVKAFVSSPARVGPLAGLRHQPCEGCLLLNWGRGQSVCGMAGGLHTRFPHFEAQQATGRDSDFDWFCIAWFFFVPLRCESCNTDICASLCTGLGTVMWLLTNHLGGGLIFFLSD